MARFSRWIDRFALYIALAAAWTAMLGSLYFSEIKGYVPCDLCWYQRILMYPLTLILAIGISVRDKWLPRIVLPLSVLGMGVAGYHYMLEKTDIFPKDVFCRAGASCTTMWINWFGFVTIPFLSLTAFTIITVMCIVAILGREPRQVEDDAAVDAEATLATEDDEDALDPAMQRAWPTRPWLLVTSIVGIIIVIYAYLFYTGAQEKARNEALVEAMQSTLTVASVAGDMSEVDDAATPPSSQAIVESAEIAKAHSLFAISCAACHGASGEGVAGLGNNLQANTWISAHSDEEVFAMVRAGRELSDPDNATGMVMPPSGGQPNLTDSDLQAIILYLRDLQ